MLASATSATSAIMKGTAERESRVVVVGSEVGAVVVVVVVVVVVEVVVVVDSARNNPVSSWPEQNWKSAKGVSIRFAQLSSSRSELQSERSWTMSGHRVLNKS